MIRSRLPLVPGMLAALALAGCAAAGSGLDGGPGAPGWVAEPAAGWDEQAEPLALQVTGSAVVDQGLPAAEQAARADALTAIAAFLDAAASRFGAAVAPAQGVASAVQSARVRGKFHDGSRYFVWMSCDAGLILAEDAPAETRDELARLVARRNRG